MFICQAQSAQQSHVHSCVPHFCSLLCRIPSKHDLLTFISPCVASDQQSTEKWTSSRKWKLYRPRSCAVHKIRPATVCVAKRERSISPCATPNGPVCLAFIRLTLIPSAMFRVRGYVYSVCAIQWFSLGPTVFESTPTLISRSHSNHIYTEKKGSEWKSKAHTATEQTGDWKKTGKKIVENSLHTKATSIGRVHFKVNGINIYDERNLVSEIHARAADINKILNDLWINCCFSAARQTARDAIIVVVEATTHDTDSYPAPRVPTILIGFCCRCKFSDRQFDGRH